MKGDAKVCAASGSIDSDKRALVERNQRPGVLRAVLREHVVICFPGRPTTLDRGERDGAGSRSSRRGSPKPVITQNTSLARLRRMIPVKIGATEDKLEPLTAELLGKPAAISRFDIAVSSILHHPVEGRFVNGRISM